MEKLHSLLIIKDTDKRFEAAERIFHYGIYYRLLDVPSGVAMDSKFRAIVSEGLAPLIS